MSERLCPANLLYRAPLLAILFIGSGADNVAAQTDVHNTGAAGNWTAVATWQGGVVPNNGTPPGSTYNAFLDAGGTYTVTLDGSSTPPSITVSNLTLNNVGTTLSIGSSGTLNIGSSASLIAGAVQLTGGTLSGGSYSTTGGVIRFNGSSTNILNNVTIGSAGVIDLSPTGSFARLEGTTSLAAGSYAIGQNSTLVFNQAATLTGIAVTLGGGGAGVFADGGNTVTLPSGSSVSVGVAGTSVTLGVNRLTANAGTVLLNQGTVGFAAGATNTTLNINTVQGNGSFQNSGTVQANLSGDIVTFGIALNNLAGGQVIAPTGGTVNVNGGLNNAGTLVVSGGILNLASAFTTAQLGTVNHTAGTVNIATTLTNTSANLTLTDVGPNPTGSFTLAGGTISGGTVTVAGSAKLLANGSASNILNNVTLNSAGVIDLSPSSSFLRLEGTTALPAGSYTIGQNSALVFNQAATLTGIAVTLGGGGAGVFADGGNTVTLPSGSSVSVGVAGTSVTLGVNRLTANAGTVLLNQGTVGFAAGATNTTLNINTVQGNGSFQNSGTVQANLSGDIVTFGIALNNLAGGQVIAPTGGTVNVNGGLNNAGTLVVSGGILNLASPLTTAQLGTVNHTAGTVNIATTLTNTSANLTLTDVGPNPTGSFTLAGGTISGGTVTVAGSAKLLANGSASNILNNVTLNSAGVIDLSPSSSFLRLEGTTALPAGSYTIGQNSALVFNQAATLTGIAVTLGGGGAGVFADGGNTVTLPSGSSVSVGVAGTSVTLGVNRLTANAGTVLLNQGTVGFAAGATNTTLNINTVQGNGSFQNSGTVQANLSGDIVTFGIALNNLAGGQVIAPTGGTVNVNGGLNNAGTLVVSGGILNLASAFTTAQLGTVNHTAGTVNIAATLTNTTLALTDAGPNPTGSFTLAGGTISGGTVTVAGSAKLLANGSASNILNNVTLNSAGVIDLSPSSSFLRLEGTTALPAGSYTIGQNSALVFNQAATVTGIALTLGGSNAGVFADGGNTVTLPSGSSVSVGAASITTTLGVNRLVANAATVLLNQGTIGFATGATNSTLNITTFQGNGAFQNSGTVQANLSGDIVNFGIPLNNLAGGQIVTSTGTVNVNGGLNNAGTLVVSGGILNLASAFTTAQLGTVNHTAGTVNIAATMTNTGATLALTDAGPNPTGSFTLAAGTITGGTVTAAGTARLLAGNLFSNILNNVTLGSAGVIDLSPGASFLRLEGTTALPAGGYTIGSSSTLVFNQATTVTGTALTLGNNAGVFADGGNTVTLSASSSVTVGTVGSTGTLGVNRVNANAATVLLNQGAVGFAAGATNSTLNISTFQGNGSFQNSGTVQANTTGSTVTISMPTFTNTGTLSANSGTISLPAATNFTNFSAGTLTGGTYQVFASSVINFNGRVITTVAPNTTVLLDGASSVFTAANTITTNNGSFTISNGRQHTAASFTNSGSLVVGTAPGDLATLIGSVQVNSGGIVKGTGTIAGPVNFASNSTLAPGTSPGILTVTGAVTMTSGANYSIELNGNAPGTGHTQLNLTGGGSINLNNATLSSSLGYAPAPADVFTIISGGPVAGTFNGLPNNSTFVIGSFQGNQFRATIVYTANSVLLTQPVPEPIHVLLVGAGVGAVIGSLRRRTSRKRT